MRIAQISDFHYTHVTYNPFRLFSKRVLGTLNFIFRRKKDFFEERLEELIPILKDLEVDLLLLGGDFTTTALKEEFEKAKKWVNKVHCPWIAIPGNHDRYTKKSCKSRLFYRYFSHPQEVVTHETMFFHLKEHRIEAKKLDDPWWIVALDTAIATKWTESSGLFSEKLEGYLKEVLSLIPKEAHILLFNHYPLLSNESLSRALVRKEHLEKIIKEDPRIKLYLHGHTHRNSIADLRANGLPIILDSGSVALGKSGSFNYLDLQKDTCLVTSYNYNSGWKKGRSEEFSW